MDKPSESNRRRLFALDAGLRAAADRMLEESGLGRIIRAEGFKPAGSYAMKVMTWRELDFERGDNNPTLQEHWKLGKVFYGNPNVWGLRYVDASRDPRTPGDEGFYWRLEATGKPAKDYWTIDLWTARPEVFLRGAPQRPLWMSRLNDDSRYYILEIKEIICKLLEYRRIIHSWDIYTAVLENGVKGIDEFWEWWKRRRK
ncbi:MAG: hypothetical protein ACYDG5_00420 [Dehalococcoidales bacterium]